MKQFFSVLLFALCGSAFATDYEVGQCPVVSPISVTAGTAGPGNCTFGSHGVNAATFSDTMTFVLGNWTEFYGTWVYSSSQEVTVSGAATCISTGGRGSHPACYSIVIDSASIDGVPVVPPASGYTWTLGADLNAGPHTVNVTGHATGATQYAHWSMSVVGVEYTLQPLTSSN
jgi:hypothetical protein